MAGPGTRYLAERRRDLAERRALPEVAALREALRPLLKAERVERHAAGRLLATAYDLVPRAQVAAYEEIVRREAALLAPYRVAASGPWPPYAFAPGAAP
jgi:gas vesicle protein GvpL/GvpF